MAATTRAASLVPKQDDEIIATSIVTTGFRVMGPTPTGGDSAQAQYLPLCNLSTPSSRSGFVVLYPIVPLPDCFRECCNNVNTIRVLECHWQTMVQQMHWILYAHRKGLVKHEMLWSITNLFLWNVAGSYNDDDADVWTSCLYNFIFVGSIVEQHCPYLKRSILRTEEHRLHTCMKQCTHVWQTVLQNDCNTLDTGLSLTLEYQHKDQPDFATRSHVSNSCSYLLITIRQQEQNSGGSATTTASSHEEDVVLWTPPPELPILDDDDDDDGNGEQYHAPSAKGSSTTTSTSRCREVVSFTVVDSEWVWGRHPLLYGTFLASGNVSNALPTLGTALAPRPWLCHLHGVEETVWKMWSERVLQKALNPYVLACHRWNQAMSVVFVVFLVSEVVLLRWSLSRLLVFGLLTSVVGHAYVEWVAKNSWLHPSMQEILLEWQATWAQYHLEMTYETRPATGHRRWGWWPGTVSYLHIRALVPKEKDTSLVLC